MTDERLAAVARQGFDDYWTEDCAGLETEAWAASAKAVLTLSADRLQLQEALACLSSVMRAASHVLVGLPPSEKEAKLRDVLSKAHDWYMAEDTAMRSREPDAPNVSQESGNEDVTGGAR